MRFVFIDEQYQNKGSKSTQYTAVIAAIFDANIIHDYRMELVSEYIKILNLPSSKEAPVIHLDLPELHGSDLLRDYSDDVKIGVLNLLCNLLKKYDIKIIRLGYFNESVSYFLDSNPARLSLCLNELAFSTRNYIHDNYCFIYEFDEQNISKTQYNDINYVNVLSQMQDRGVETSFTGDTTQNLGRFYCEKGNYCMYAADVIGYLLKKEQDNSTSGFGAKLVELAKSISGQVLQNEIISYKSM